MNTQKGNFISNNGTWYPGVLKEVKRSNNVLQPIFEAFTNALEAIESRPNKNNNGSITITITSTDSAYPGKLIFQNLKIEDTGIGFDDTNFERLKMYKDDRKGPSNKGSGRLQFIHYFDNAAITSIYNDGDFFKERSFKMSANEEYLKQNSIIQEFEPIASTKTEPGTTIYLSGIKPFAENNYSGLTAETLKQELVSRYTLYFCLKREAMPKIEILHYNNNQLLGSQNITSEDIPSIDRTQDFEIAYNRLDEFGQLLSIDTKEQFTLKCLKVSKDKLKKNSIKLTSKDEIIEQASIPLHLLRPDEEVDGNRFLFLISSEFIDKRDSDSRGQFNIKSKRDFLKENGENQTSSFTQEDIFFDDIVDATNSTIRATYPEIASLKQEQQKGLEELKTMFLLDDSTLKNLTINLNDTEEEILNKFYKAEAKDNAHKDAQLKRRIESLDSFDPTAPDYHQRLQEEITTLVKEIPLQNRAVLSHYVARRKLVLDLFKRIYNQELNIQKREEKERQKPEALLHSLIFKQKSTDAADSDLWLINEDFIYFNGTSDVELKDITYNEERLFKLDSELSEEEIKYRRSLGEDRFQKRPDVLLFPSEGKCVIIEFKSPEVNVSDHLTQIHDYATMIRNFSTDEFQFYTFYGYLIGEAIEPLEVRFHDSEFIVDAHFDYVFRPAKKIAGVFNGRKDGSIYTEVMKYSTLLNRATKRNEIFIKKLMGDDVELGPVTSIVGQPSRKRGRPKKEV